MREENSITADHSTGEPCVAYLGFGGAPIGNLYKKVSDEDAFAALTAAWGAGVRLFDTAPHYGFGLSEERMGEFFSSRIRDEYEVSTKVGRVLKPVDGEQADRVRHGFVNARPYEPVFDYSYDGVMASFESSLERLGLSRIDILYAHDLGRVTHGNAHEEHWRIFSEGGFRAMRRLRDEGAVSRLGVGANEWEISLQAINELEGLDCFLLAGRYTLVEQGALDMFLPVCAERGLSVYAGGPFNSGILATGASEDSKYNYERAPDDVRGKVKTIEKVAADFGVPMPAAALAFPFYHKAVAAVVAGFSSAAEVESAKENLALKIPEDFWKALRAAGVLSPAAPAPDLVRAA